MGVFTIEGLLNGSHKLFQLVSLYTVTDDGHCQPVNFNMAVDKITKAAEMLIDRIEITTQRPIAEFTIGKSTTKKSDKKKNFDPCDSDTWDVYAIENRWYQYEKNLTYTGLVVLCSITQEMLPFLQNKDSKSYPIQNQEHYALALEQQLIHYFAYKAKDKRLGNTSFSPGRLTEDTYAGVVYLAFKLSSIRGVWQHFQDSYELEKEPNNNIFIIITEDTSPLNVPGAQRKRIIGGREDKVIKFLRREDLINKKLKIFVNYIPSEKFVKKLLKVRPVNETSVIIARNIENSTETLQFLLNNGCIVRDFAEDDWSELGTTLYNPVHGITDWKAKENEKLKKYLEKTREEVWRMFANAEGWTGNEKQELTRPKDMVFLLSYTGGLKIITGRIVEKRVIHFLKDHKRTLGHDIKIYINYKPNENFVKLLAKTLNEEDKKISVHVSVPFWSDVEITENPIKIDALIIEMRKYTSQDLNELIKHLYVEKLQKISDIQAKPATTTTSLKRRYEDPRAKQIQIQAKPATTTTSLQKQYEDPQAKLLPSAQQPPRETTSVQANTLTTNEISEPYQRLTDEELMEDLYLSDPVTSSDEMEETNDPQFQEDGGTDVKLLPTAQQPPRETTSVQANTLTTNENSESYQRLTEEELMEDLYLTDPETSSDENDCLDEPTDDSQNGNQDEHTME